MKPSNWNDIANQFIIETGDSYIFQSYNNIIAIKSKNTWSVTLDERYWNYSNTTWKYRNIFLGENKKETDKNIKDGFYILTNLN